MREDIVVTGPSISPFHIDAARIGGSKAAQRHAFGVAPAPAREKPRFIPPPPRRELSEGTPVAPELSQAQVKNIQDSIAPIIDAILYELEAVKVEADWVSGPTLRVEPELYKSIGEIGAYFTPQQIRTQVMIDSEALGNAASRILSGAASPYLSAEQRTSLQTAVSDANALRNYVQQFDIEPITGAATKLSQDHVESHTSKVLESIKEVERGIVTTEAGSIPVIEPAERGLGVTGLIAVGALIAVGIIIADLV